MSEYPQVVLFGSIAGGWREEHVIPVLEDLKVTYYNPVSATGWTPELGEREAEVMAHCETIVMVLNKTAASFTSLAETGWAALGASLRNQHFILQVDLDYELEVPAMLEDTEEGRRLGAFLKHWTKSSRYLVYKHAEQFKHDTFHLVDDMEGVLHQLREIYGM